MLCICARGEKFKARVLAFQTFPAYLAKRLWVAVDAAAWGVGAAVCWGEVTAASARKRAGSNFMLRCAKAWQSERAKASYAARVRASGGGTASICARITPDTSR